MILVSMISIAYSLTWLALFCAKDQDSLKDEVTWSESAYESSKQNIDLRLRSLCLAREGLEEAL